MTTAIKRNMQHSFSAVREDMHNIYDHLRFLYAEIDRLKDISPERSFVASKTARKLHATTCVFAKNIKKENMLLFETVEEAVGFSTCKCV